MVSRVHHVSSLSFLFFSFCPLMLSHVKFILALRSSSFEGQPSVADGGASFSSSRPSSVAGGTGASGSSFSRRPRFREIDNYLIDCGSSSSSGTGVDDDRIFIPDSETSSFLSTKSPDVKASIDSIPTTAFSNSTPSSMQELYKTARIFTSNATYTFSIDEPGKHWVRLYFYPLPHPQYNLKTAVFDVHTEKFTLLHHFSATSDTKVVFKEYLVNASGSLSLIFTPKNKEGFAFINAIEVVSIPDEILSDSATSVSQGKPVNGLLSHAMQVCYRINMGGQTTITPKDDPLSRTWEPDAPYIIFPQVATAVNDSKITYQPDKGVTPLVAPEMVYATAQKLTEARFNLTWMMEVDSSFSYLIRMHFCDIVSKSLNDLYLNVYINGLMVLSNLDLTAETGGVAMAYYKDLLLNATEVKLNDTIKVQVGPTLKNGRPVAILNGLEIMKLTNKYDSFDGDDGGLSKMKILAIAGLIMAVLGMLVLGMVILKWKRRPHDWQKKYSLSSWLLPIHCREKSKSKKRFHGRVFTLKELQTATQDFDETTVIGVGGFGKVFVGVVEDGTKVAIKRANRGSSDQGINEFETEIQMLSKLIRHPNLVSLIGFCDKNSEMILVYEYMANGPFRDHLYGSNKPTLSWKQRLEICIGSARGLHYLHKGAEQGIIHRDVKTTNILLDENFVAKVSDFGLSKAAPMKQGHVSTAVKGSFGYLDPEYFKRQQLTEKSDVYSFGVLLFEVLCARAVICPTLPRDQVVLADWAMQLHKKGQTQKIVDPKIAGSINEESLKKFVEAAEKCLAEYGVDRPTMGEVLKNLEHSLELQEASDLAEDHNKSEVIDLEDQSESSGDSEASPSK